FSAGLTATYLLGRYAYPTNLQHLFWIGFATSFVSPFLIACLREVPFPAQRSTESLGEFLRGIPAHVRSAPGFLRFMVTRAFLGVGIIANSFYALYSLEKFDPDEGY